MEDTSVGIRDVKFERTDPALGPKSGPAGLLHSINESRGLMLGSE